MSCSNKNNKKISLKFGTPKTMVEEQKKASNHGGVCMYVFIQIFFNICILYNESVIKMSSRILIIAVVVGAGVQQSSCSRRSAKSLVSNNSYKLINQLGNQSDKISLKMCTMTWTTYSRKWREPTSLGTKERRRQRMIWRV